MVKEQPAHKQSEGIIVFGQRQHAVLKGTDALEWLSTSRLMLTSSVIVVLAAMLAQDTATGPAPASLDYAFFRDRVQPIFLKSRPGHARCIVCHDHGSPVIEPLSPGATFWSDEQSRKNFESWEKLVVKGEPLSSRFLLHPLAVSAGGDHFHAGGKHWESQSDLEWQTLAAWVSGQKTPVSGKVRVIQTNAAGDGASVIDPATNRVIASIGDIEVPHGVAISPDGARIYITDEPRKSLDVVDAKSFQVTQRILLSGRPNNLDISKDGTHVYVGIAEAPGAVDIIDTASNTRTKTVPVDGAVHNVYVTPDGKFVVSGSVATSVVSVIDTRTNTLAWSIKLASGIRPMTFTVNPDGSTKELIAQLSNFHGFVIVDFATRKEIKQITLPDPPGQHKNIEGLQGSPAHGLAITKDGKILWVASKWYGYVAAYSLPDWQLLSIVPVGSHPEWLTIPPDGKNLYVAVAGENTTVVVDNQTRKVIATVPVGQVPKRNASGLLQTN